MWEESRPMANTTRAGSYRELVVWQKAFQLCLSVYSTSRKFPDEERFGLTTEIRKTARSVVYNIAEGQQRHTVGEFKRFLVIARGSQGELEAQLLLAAALEYLTNERAGDLLEQAREVGRMLFGLERAIGDHQRRLASP